MKRSYNVCQSHGFSTVDHKGQTELSFDWTKHCFDWAKLDEIVTILCGDPLHLYNGVMAGP